MQTALSFNSINNINSGTVIYSQGTKVESVSFVLKGRVLVYNQGIKTVMGAGSFIGINDVFAGSFTSSYVAAENVIMYTFEVRGSEDIRNIMNANNDYNGLMVYHLNMYISELGNQAELLRNMVDELAEFIDLTYIENADLFTDRSVQKYEDNLDFAVEETDYYEEASKLPIEVQKTYFGNSMNLTMLHISKQAILINTLINECNHLAAYGGSLFEQLYNDRQESIFNVIAREGLGNNGSSSRIAAGFLERVVDEINKAERILSEKTGTKPAISKDRMEELFMAVTAADSSSAVSADIQMKYSGNMSAEALEAMENSLDIILEYAETEGYRKEEIHSYIDAFRVMKDKSVISEASRELRRNITEAYYELYMKIFVKAFNDRNLNRVVELFLTFGFMDEKLLTNDQCIELYYLQDENNNAGKSRVYTVWSWLKAIYTGKKEPSKNEFDLEYIENLREMKKTRKVLPEEEKDYLTNPLRKVEYEIKNMFKYNNRVVSGQISVFVPVLHSGIINRTLSKMFITTDKANAEIDRLLEIDYSAYSRQILYYDESKGIQKEYVIKTAYPDIIMMPTVGGNSVMWQEIEGRKRDTSGRFIIPVFCDTDLFEQLVKLTGRFRFELCRTIEGVAWNNIQEKSLTSEYADYIQFYNKNRELSEEQKNKIKQQIQRGRNNLREIFTIDYMVWIQNESQGYLRLSKPSRIIMSTYCPFSKVIREKNVKQPIFMESMARYLKDKQKNAREYTLLVSKLGKDKIEVPAEIEETRRFYCDL